MTRAVKKIVLSAAVATSGTFTVGYPTGWNGGHFIGGVGHIITSSYGKWVAPVDFTVSFGLASATVTYKGATTIASGTELWVEFDTAGRTRDELTNNALPAHVSTCPLHIITIGAPITADADGIATVQLVGAAGPLTLDGAGIVGGEYEADVPRNVTLTGATTNHSARTFTVTGEDVHGNAMVETLAGPNNNTVAGKKAFAKVTSVTVDGQIATNGVSVGFGDVLGLPVHLPAGGCVLAELEDLVAVGTAGTFVAGTGAGTVSTATSADVRGTYDPNSACNGAKAFTLIVALPNPDFLGNAQYAG